MTISWARSKPEELRAHHARDAAEMAGALPEDVVETELAPEGAFRGGLLFTPRDCVADAVFVYFHGGGFVAGSPETHRCMTAWLARLSRMRVFSARHRLAPEHPFPAQREDAVAACGAMTGEASIFLAGDSAGACIALWGLQGLDAPMRARIAGLVLLYGGYGLIESASIARYGTPENGLDSQTLAVMYRRLGGDVTWPTAFAGEITEPAYVLAAEIDAVLDDSTRLFGRLGANPANLLTVVKGEDHGFFKRTGRDCIALKELENAAGWAAERLAQRRSKMQA
jgi:acetyl esterase